MDKILAEFSKANILVVGDVMLDRYCYGSTERISPEAPVPVVKLTAQENRPGGAANVAVNVVSLGAKAQLFGMVGEDANSNALKQSLGDRHVNAHLLSSDSTPTICKTRIVSQNQQLLRLDDDGDYFALDKSMLHQQIQTTVSTVNLMVLSDYQKGTLSNAHVLIEMAKKANVMVLVDPKGDDFSGYHGADLLTPNQKEFERIVGPCRDETTLIERGLQLIDDCELGALLITRGANGMILLRPGIAHMHFPVQAREVFDVTGAGDTVIAVLATALASGETIETAAHLANYAAGIVVGRLGTAAVTAEDLLSAIEAREVVL